MNGFKTTPRRAAARTLLALTIAVVLAAVAAPAIAATFVVTKTADTADGMCDSDCSLREAVIAANTTPGADTINLPGGFYLLDLVGAGEDAAASGDLDVTEDLAIIGSGVPGTEVNGNGTDRIFDIPDVNGVDLDISDVRLRQGHASAGGAVQVIGVSIVTLTRCLARDNTADSVGGALATDAGGFSVIESSLIDNSAGNRGGAIYVSDNEPLVIVDSTITGNTAAHAGAINILFGSSDTTIVNSTITRNTADEESGGIWIDGADVYLTNSTILGNTSADTSGNDIGISDGEPTTLALENTVLGECAISVFFDIGVSITATSVSHNLFETLPGCGITMQAGDILGDPRLDIFANSPLPWSPVIDAGDDALCPTLDRLGQARDDGNGNGVPTCDIGAVEFQALAVTKTTDTADGVCDADCSLREAIIAANDSPGHDFVVLPPGNYSLSIPGVNEDAALTGDLDLLYGLTIAGPNAATTVIDADGIDRVLDNFSVFDDEVMIQGVTITGGDALFGGGISNIGTMLLTDLTVIGNTSLGNGGGIYTRGALYVDRCTVAENTAGGGGGGLFAFEAPGSIAITNSTIANNWADDDGGGIFHINSQLRVTGTTIANNDAYSGYGGGIYISGAVNAILDSSTVFENGSDSDTDVYSVLGQPLQLRNTILADECSQNIVSLDYNHLPLAPDCPVPLMPHDTTVSPPNLGPFTDDGRPGRGHLPLVAGSVQAIDHGDDGNCPAEDQLIHTRPADGDHNGTAECDIGAAEFFPVRTSVVSSRVAPASGSAIAVRVIADMTDSGDRLGSFGGTLSWDPGVLQYGFVDTTGFPGVTFNENHTDFGRLAFSAADAAGSDGFVEIACLQFDVSGPDRSASLLDLELTSIFAALTFEDLDEDASANDVQILPTRKCTIGDTNDDDAINSGDALAILSDTIELSLPDEVERGIVAGCGDANGDQVLNATDANVVLSSEVGLPIDSNFPIGDSNITIDGCLDAAPTQLARAVSRSEPSDRFISTRLERVFGETVGQTVDVVVIVDTDLGITRLGSYSALLRWDSERIRLLDVDSGRTRGFDSPLLNRSREADGVLRLAAASPSGAAGRIELLRLRFSTSNREVFDLGELFHLEFDSMATTGPAFDDLMPHLDSEVPDVRSR